MPARACRKLDGPRGTFSAVRSGLVALATAWCAGGCARSEIVVVVDTDIPRAEMDGFRVLVFPQEHIGSTDETDAVLDRPIHIQDEPPAVEGEPDYRLPGSFGVGPAGGDADREVWIVLQGTSTTLIAEGNDRGLTGLRATAVVGFVDGEKRRLDMFLAAACVDAACDPGQTCIREEGCVPEEQDASALPVWPEQD